MKLDIPAYVLLKIATKDDGLIEDSSFADFISESSTNTDVIVFDTKSTPEVIIKEVVDFMKLINIDEIDISKDKYTSRWSRNDEERLEKDTKKIRQKISLSLKRYKRHEKLIRESAVKKVTSLSSMPQLVESYVKGLDSQIFYRLIQGTDDTHLPWCIDKCTYHSKTSYNDTPYVTVKFKAVHLNDEISTQITILFNDLFNSDGEKQTVPQILDNNGFSQETEELKSEYDRQYAKYRELVNSKGRVYVGSGIAKRVQSEKGWSGRLFRNENTFYFKKTGIKNNVVIDHYGYDRERSDKEIDETIKLFQVKTSLSASNVLLPTHPFVHTYHLEEHTWLIVHVDNLTEYEFQGQELSEKLVLPKENKELIDILMHTSKIDIDDIVAGKKGGSFIMTTGPAGVGKTLTAEVFSETIGLPLYKVQCSQLGLNIDEVEKNLQLILTRAESWGAILLIDEADVYVRKRSTDIQQNAIVGVFLRTLEYYTGILFMTSNMGDDIDDAIMSRATAHIEYKAPTDSDRQKIWHILNEQFGTGLSESDIQTLTIELPNIVGRDIKTLLKLSKMYASSKSTPITVEFIKSICKFAPHVKLEVN